MRLGLLQQGNSLFQRSVLLVQLGVIDRTHRNSFNVPHQILVVLTQNGNVNLAALRQDGRYVLFHFHDAPHRRYQRVEKLP